ncbi:MAG: Flp pilus assembly complex ATPase component TadA [Acidobacteria bacterium]|nr:Flp pilus assembly complex ATPase component TadA [Acidobacteriota bacterium]
MPRGARQDVVALLLLSEYFPPEDLARLVQRSQETHASLWDVLAEEKKVSEEMIADLFARRLRIPRVRLSHEIPGEVIKLVPEKLARRHLCLPLWTEKNKLFLCLGNPADLNAIREVEFHTGYTVSPVVATRSEILGALDRYYGGRQDLLEFHQTEELTFLQPVEDVDLDEDESRESAKLSPVVKLVMFMLVEGLRTYASDIHIEPGETQVQVRNRVDGLLRDVMVVPKWLHDGVVSRIKILSRLDISERRRSQDGHMKVRFRDQQVDLRVSTLPTRDGEKVVLRVLGSGKGIPSVTQLGMEEDDFERLLQAVEQPQGMILVTGPTGSGKTTTLYSVLARKKTPTLNIVTIEDPIEFRLPGVNQVQVSTRTGMTFAKCLRSILRQDPDVILLGEIRDQETAEIAFHSAMTGHMVLSSLHTNTAVGSVYRLLELDIEPFLVSSCVNLVIAQRLVRKVCPKCRESYTPEPALLKRLGLGEPEGKFIRGKGCNACGQTGYAGREGLFELLAVTPRVQRAISERASEEQVLKIAREDGMHLLMEDALRKIKKGITTVEEVLRVTYLREETSLRCPRCEATIRPGFSTCPQCMAALRKLCASCGQELREEWKICPYCNNRVAEAGEAEKRPENWVQ